MKKNSRKVMLALLLSVIMLFQCTQASAAEGEIKYDFDRIEVVYAAEFAVSPRYAAAEHWLTTLAGGTDKPVHILYGIVHLFTGEQFIEEQFISMSGEGGSERFLSNSMSNEFDELSMLKKQTSIQFWSGKKLDESTVVKDYTQPIKSVTLVQSFDQQGLLTGYQLNAAPLFRKDNPPAPDYYVSSYVSDPSSLVHTGELNGAKVESEPEVQSDQPLEEVSILSSSDPANAGQRTIQADTLKQLGLFMGTNYGYQLGDPITRAQGAVMLLRLSGEADDAARAQLKSSFTDVKSSHWAVQSIAYAVSKGYVKGIGNGQFAPDRLMTGKEFLTLINRLLGYPNATTSNAAELSRNNGLLTVDAATRLANAKPFLRGDMVEVVYAALQTKQAGKTSTLLQSLVEEKGSISVELATASGLYVKPNVPAYYIPKPGSDPMDSIEQAIRQKLDSK
ncbi:S-layer homology domain-containing protein [Paenibacillus glycanilyticus]|uniref:S-layer homology domain-containing protein n=1 Tax=Paenibacillus glycanilyticus TaxID=126569 RepID=UPI00203F1A0A|nr:S-layer homology domain-containing protein [Paenibacillus glycanilyticus]MCM3628215.1 S-layer homology domain-containing protein [Paenibacillus glycanilyticus]